MAFNNELGLPVEAFRERNINLACRVTVCPPRTLQGLRHTSQFLEQFRMLNNDAMAELDLHGTRLKSASLL